LKKNFKSIFIVKYKASLKFLFVTANVFLILIIGYIFNLRAGFINKKLLQSQIIYLKKQLSEKQKVYLDYNLYKENINFLSKKIFLYPDAIRKFSNGERLLALISGQLLPKPLINRHLTFLSRKKQAVFTKFTVEVLLEGNKKYIIALLDQMTRCSYPILLNTFKCRFSYSKNKSLDESGKLYLLVDVYQGDDVSMSAVFSEQSHNNLFDDKRLQQGNKNPLTHYSIKELEMRGFLSVNLKKIGLVQLPDKKNYKVQKGEKIGLEQAEIIYIGREKIVLCEKDGQATVELKIKSKDY
jgi:hypothetical protein